MKHIPIVLLTLASLHGCSQSEQNEKNEMNKPDTGKVVKSEEEWRKELSPLEYSITRERGTERAFTGEYWDFKEDGTYQCKCCGSVLFDSDTKYDSGCGWPSFYDVADKGKVKLIEDRSFGMVRTEIRCSKCDAHLGHVFDDGPKPTGLRYCINSASLKFNSGK